MYSSNATEMTITLLNGSVIWFKTARDADALYGEDVYAAVIDEATRVSAESWHAVRSTLTATRGPLRIIGNVKGTDNWAYALARKAQAGAPGWHYSKLTAWDAVAGGILDRAEVEDAKAVLPADVFAELYLAEPSDRTRFFKGTPPYTDVVPTGGRVCRAWDMAVTPPKPGRDPDWTVGAKIVQHGGMTYVADIIRVRESADKVMALFSRTALTDGCDQVVEEERGASGKMFLASLKTVLANAGAVVGLHAASVTGDKATRAYMFAADWNAGKVALVDAGWNADLLAETDYFPGARHDDIVDACVHGYNHLAGRTYATGSFRLPGTRSE
jgi:predicted phage terminase large subunit-like protein